jgi:nicotinamide-nucleotide amidase
MKVLKVSPETIRNVGAVHEKTAAEMAAGVRLISGATYGISTSGIAGPDGGTPEKPVGTVCLGLATPEGTHGHRYCFPKADRSVNKLVFALAALDWLRRHMTGLAVGQYF